MNLRLLQIVKLCFLFIFSFSLLSALDFTKEEKAWIAEHPIVKVGGSLDWVPFDFTEDGRHKGVSSEYLKLIVQKTGLTFDIEIDLWKNNLQKMQNKSIDLLPALYHTDARAKYMHYTKSYLEILDYFFIRDDLNVTSMDDLNGKTVVLTQSDARIDIVKKKFPRIKILTVPTFNDTIDALLEHKADILLESYATVMNVLKKESINTIEPFRSYRAEGRMKLYMASHKSNPLLASIIDKGLHAITQKERQAIHIKWFGKKSKITQNQIGLTQKEKEWIASHDTVLVGVDNAWEPFDFINKDGKHDGMSADYLRLVSQKTGLNFAIAEHKNWSSVLEAAKEKKLDMIAAIAPSSERETYLNFTDAYMKYAFVLASADTNSFFYDISDFNGKRIGVIDSYITEDILKENYPKIEVVTYTNLHELLEAITSHKVDAIFDNAVSIAYHTKKEGYSQIKMVTIGEHKRSITMGVTKDNMMLLSILNKALNSIGSAEKANIRNRWISFEYEQTIDYTLAYQVLGFFFFFVLGTWYWYRKLNHEVEKRKESEKQMTMLIETIPLNVVVSDFAGNILRANIHAIEDFNSTAEELYQHNVMAFYNDPSERVGVIDTIKREGKLSERIIKFQQLDGTQKDMLLSIMPIVYNGNKALLTIMVDMTERVEMEEKLRHSKILADSANKSKSEFLANMSHEIRTPMNAIMGFTELLSEQVKETRLKSYIKTIHSAGNTLLTLINDILDLSKIEVGKFEINKRAMNIFELVNDIGNMFLMTVRNKGLDLIIEIDENIPKSLLLDEVRLRQVIVNLLGNAVKFTETGYVKLKIEAFNIDDHLSKLDLEISVEDTGIGIQESQQQFIFKSFEQQEGQENRKYGGTGLGLTVSKRLTEMMGGKVSLKSETGKGAIFYVHLYGVDISSVVVEDESALKNALNAHTIRFKPAIVLVVDDIEDNRELIVRNFEDTKLNIVIAVDGVDAIEQFKSAKPDLILMDIRMPNMDGYEAAHKIKEMDSAIPIIALTASVMQDEHERTKSEHFDGYLRKPVLRDDLFLELSYHLAYDKLEPSKKQNEQTYSFELDDSIRIHLDAILTALDEKIIPLYENAMKRNNIDDIKVFMLNIETLALKYEFKSLQEYASLLAEAIDAFDIVKMQSLLRDYSSLKSQLESIVK